VEICSAARSTHDAIFSAMFQPLLIHSLTYGRSINILKTVDEEKNHKNIFTVLKANRFMTLVVPESNPQWVKELLQNMNF
jgi:hypothetical protein